MKRKRNARTSHESSSTDETVNPDFEYNNSIITPKQMLNLIMASTVLSQNTKAIVHGILWLVFTNKIVESLAEEEVRRLLFLDLEVYSTFTNYLEQHKLCESTFFCKTMLSIA